MTSSASTELQGKKENYINCKDIFVSILMEIISGLRYYHFIAGMLANQQHDPLCSICKAFTNSLQQIRQEVDTYMMTNSAALTAPPEQVSIMLADITMLLADLHPIADAVGQKKQETVNCRRVSAL